MSNILDIFDGLDGFVPLEESTVLTSRPKVKSPLELFNCFYGGGMPYGTYTGYFGPPEGGKSTLAYTTGGYFLEQEPLGMLVIIDTESSADVNRLRMLGVDTSRVVRIVPTSIDNGYTQLIEVFDRVLDKQMKFKDGTKLPIYVVWDTISKGKAEDSEASSRMQAMNRARVIKSRNSDMIPYLEKLEVIVNNLSQVVNSTDRYGNVTMGQGGGIALQHDEHVRLLINTGKHSFDEGGISNRVVSTVSVDKSKAGPKMSHIPMYIDSTKGGVIDERASVLWWFYDYKWWSASGAWYNFNALIKEMNKNKNFHYAYKEYFETHYSGNKRFEHLIRQINDEENDALYAMLRLFFMDLQGQTYELQRASTQDYYEVVLKEAVDAGVIFKDLEGNEYDPLTGEVEVEEVESEVDEAE